MNRQNTALHLAQRYQPYANSIWTSFPSRDNPPYDPKRLLDALIDKLSLKNDAD